MKLVIRGEGEGEEEEEGRREKAPMNPYVANLG
jgi:hypothetical protein